MRFPVFEPEIGEEEIASVTDALRKGEISGSFGDYIPAFERGFADFVGVKHAVAVCNGSVALHLACAAAGIGPGDEVLVSASTNIATALGPFHCGAFPVGVDAEPETWNLDLDLLESLITPATKAIIPVHLYGHPVDMERLMAIARKHNLLVIEDCAESHGATVRGRMTGSFGDMSCFSFYANKIMTTGEGGMVLTNNDALAEKLRLLRNLAFTKPRFYHEEAGFNFRMTGYQAAFGVVQLKKLPRFVNQHRILASWYNEFLTGIPEIETPREMPWAKHVYWMYAVRYRGRRDRDAFLNDLRTAGVDTRTFFHPINSQPFLKNHPGYRNVPTPVADQLWKEGFYLPSSTILSKDHVREICEIIRGCV
jgi:perosamine synthetase